MAALAEIDATLGTHLDESAYQPTRIEFERRPAGHLDIAPFELVSDAFSVKAEGRVRTDGALTFKAQIGIAPDQLSELKVARNVLIALATAEDRTWVPVTITGTLEDPKVAVDRKALAEGVGEVARQVLETEIEKVKQRFGESVARKLEDRLKRELDALVGP